MPAMSERKKAAMGTRYFVRLADETKRRLDHLAVDAGATSTEGYGGELLTKVVDELWDRFDPKRSRHVADPAPAAKGKRGR